MEKRVIRKIVATGGIGTGRFFLFHTGETLGRNESRMASLSDAKDYCKLHIVSHYLARLLSPSVSVIPVGMVGGDADGRALRDMLARAGADVTWVRTSPRPTMFSACFQYPDKSGGNVTTDNSACMDVTPAYVEEALDQIGVDEQTVAIALPEVSLASRLALLRYAKARGALCVASCGVQEVDDFIAAGGASLCALIALNQDETAAFAGLPRVEGAAEAGAAARVILARYPHLTLWLTYGAGGSMLADRARQIRYPALAGVSVRNTGGAGDASLAGLIAGYCTGLPLMDDVPQGGLGAGELAVLTAGLSVESPDSINEAIDWETLRARRV